MSPDDARRIASVHLMREHPTIEVGQAIPDRPTGSAVAYTVHVTTRGIPGIVRVTGTGACDVTPIHLDGVRYSESRELAVIEPAT